MKIILSVSVGGEDVRVFACVYVCLCVRACVCVCNCCCFFLFLFILFYLDHSKIYLMRGSAEVVMDIESHMCVCEGGGCGESMTVRGNTLGFL
jgi:hypothetical protein